MKTALRIHTAIADSLIPPNGLTSVRDPCISRAYMHPTRRNRQKQFVVRDTTTIFNEIGLISLQACLPQ
jgi:hypothetical protein